MPNRVVEFYVDGAYSSKSQMGGWACICVENNDVIGEMSGYEPYSTNNRMEITAFLNALESANTIESGHTKVIVYTDSSYVERTFNEGWYATWLKNGWHTADRQEVKNQDLWKRTVALYIKLKSKVDLEVVRVQGHSDNKWNNYADLLAVKARRKLEV